MTDIRIGALCWNQYTDWPSLLEAGVRADCLGYDTLWTCGVGIARRTPRVAGDATAR